MDNECHVIDTDLNILNFFLSSKNCNIISVAPIKDITIIKV
ncbi:hypothetical protein [Clostridium sp.]|nr:hypothetical protein [Clostridium sp.]